MLEKKFPLSNSINARCIPHPGQSMPNSCLLKHGIMCDSSQFMIEFIYAKLMF